MNWLTGKQLDRLLTYSFEGSMGNRQLGGSVHKDLHQRYVWPMTRSSNRSLKWPLRRFLEEIS